MPGSVLGTWGISVSRTDDDPCPQESPVPVAGERRQTIDNRERKQITGQNIRVMSLLWSAVQRAGEAEQRRMFQELRELWLEF